MDGAAAGDLHQAQRVELRGDRGQVARAQEFLGQVGLGALGRFGVAVEHLLGHLGQMLLAGLQQVLVQQLSTAVAWPRKTNEPWQGC